MIAGQFDLRRAPRHVGHIDDETVHELFQVIEDIDVDHPDYAERADEWAAEYRADLAAEWAGR